MAKATPHALFPIVKNAQITWSPVRNVFLISFSPERKINATTWEPVRRGSSRTPPLEYVNNARALAELVQANENTIVTLA